MSKIHQDINNNRMIIIRHWTLSLGNAYLTVDGALKIGHGHKCREDERKGKPEHNHIFDDSEVLLGSIRGTTLWFVDQFQTFPEWFQDTKRGTSDDSVSNARD